MKSRGRLKASAVGLKDRQVTNKNPVELGGGGGGFETGGAKKRVCYLEQNQWVYKCFPLTGHWALPAFPEIYVGLMGSRGVTNLL